jgi:agmatinase
MFIRKYSETPSFLSADWGDDNTVGVDVGVLGIPFTTPDTLEDSRGPCSGAARTIRAQSVQARPGTDEYDFDLSGRAGDAAGGDPRPVRIIDFGDCEAFPGQYDLNAHVAADTVAGVAMRSRVLTILGGDVPASLNAVQGLSRLGPLNVLHLGPRPHWGRGVVGGSAGAVREIAALDGVGEVAIVGLRGPSRCDAKDITKARARARLIPARRLAEQGAVAVLDELNPSGHWFISLDLAALDPAIAPAVESPSFGGLDYWLATDLLTGLAERVRIAGVSVVGIAPEKDNNALTSRLAIRLVANLLSTCVRPEETAPEDLRDPTTRPAPYLEYAR